MLRMILFVAPLVAAAFTLPCGTEQPAAPGEKEVEAVKRAVLDYVEGVYDVKPENIERSVHKDLTKIGFARRKADEEYRELKMTQQQLIDLCKDYNKDGTKVPADAPKKIEILDVMDQTAAAKLTASWGIDYFHLAKFDGKWKIIHVLWQTHPME